MTDLKNDLQVDAIGYLYRAAFYLAKGDSVTALNFLNQTAQRIPPEKLDLLKPLLDQPREQLADKQQELYWAEKILDEYKILFNSLKTRFLFL